MRNVAGLSATDAQKSSDMLLKCRYIDEITDSRGVVFATGTPVSNSMTELYNADKRIRKELEKSIQSVTLKLRAVSQKRTRLYEDFADGILSDEEYAYAKTSFDERWETLNRQLDELTAKKSQYSETMSGENKWIRQMKSVEVTDTLTKAIVDATIEKVFIHENKAVEIIFKYHDIFKQTERYLAELSAKEGDAK